MCKITDSIGRASVSICTCLAPFKIKFNIKMSDCSIIQAVVAQKCYDYQSMRNK